MSTTTKMKVLFCTDGIFPHQVGGMQRHSRLLVEALAETGLVELVVIHPHPGIQVFNSHPAITEIALPPLPGKKYYLFELWDYSKQVLEIARQYPEHLIYSQGLSIWAGIRTVSERLIVNPHGLEPYQVLGLKDKVKTWMFRRAFDYIFRRAGRVVSLGGRLTPILQSRMGSRANRIVVLPNATQDPGDLRPIAPPSKMGFFFAGRFAWNKGIGILLEAAKMLNTAGYADRYSLELGGKGPLFEEMKAQYSLPNVQFLGFIPDEELQNCYFRNQVFVLPTLFEGMPTVVLEAMAAAMPVIVTDVGATLELVSAENGRIIEKNNAQDLYDAMRQFIEMDPEPLSQLAHASRQKFLQSFTWQAVAQQHLAAFAQLNYGLQPKMAGKAAFRTT